MSKQLEGLFKFFRLPDDADYEDDLYDDVDDEEYDEEEEKELKKEEERFQKEESKKAKRFSNREKESYNDSYPVSRMAKTSDKVVPIRTTPSGLEVSIMKPKNFGESQDICELLMDNTAVIVNLEGIDIMEAQRIMDFLSGCIFSINGKMSQIARYIFIFTPDQVEVSGDYFDFAQDSGFSVPTIDKEF